MAKQPEPSLVNSLQSEVAHEASPMLVFLAHHARIIIFCTVLFIVAIIAYGFYGTYSQNALEVEERELGRILVMKDKAQRLQALEAYAPKASRTMTNQVLFGIATTAQELANHPTAYAAWEKLRSIDPAMKVPGTLGMVQALQAQKKDKEALALLEALIPNLSAGNRIPVQTKIAVLAENIGDNARAVKAYEALIASSSGQENTALWQQKAATLRLTLQPAK